ncbi:MAG: aspartate aminotransferase family protein [Firmicutes bacterium HGW-Firmicutes-1]|jgi:predicted acetylornithine/succinylornithine family transaminase|nr:MAG: aspartate aminotransferase family protein [Firmicutes bacterium HGW-Firmicutes-1]
MKEVVKKGKEVFVNNYKQFPVVFEYGEGAYLFDIEGKKYLDFVSGIAVNALGYNNTELNQALKDQIDKFTHCSNLYYNQPSIDAANKLINGSGLDKVFFCNSGAEANEAALKLARKYSKKHFGEDKYEIITMKNSFHGRTIATITATGQEKYQKGLSPLLPGIKYTEYNNIEALKNIISDHTCAILLEIIQGEGGIVTIDSDYLKAVRKLCDEHNLVLIFDEVQTGIGRTGELFAYQLFNVKPDILTLAKGLGAGIPIGAMVANEKVADGFEPGDHASTFGGNPLACTAANIILDKLINGDLQSNVKEQGAYLNKKLIELMNKKDSIIDIRGIGLIQGIALQNEDISAIIHKCMEEGLLLVGAGSNVIRFVPPLIISEKEIDEAIKILDKCI